MRVVIDSILKGKYLSEYLIKNKKTLINTKKSMPIFSDQFSHSVHNLNPETSTNFKTKNESSEPNVARVKVVANLSMYADSYVDVLSNTSFDKTIKENGPQGKGVIMHLKDHNHSTQGIIGKPTALYGEEFDLKKEFGIDSHIKKGRALIGESDVKKKYDAKSYELYLDGLIKQHSIGLWYKRIELALNDPEEKEEFSVWDTVFDKIINPAFVEKKGYFWYVKEYQLIEYSSVIQGANPITPTLSVTKTDSAPGSNPTHSKPEVFSTSENVKSILLSNY